MSMFKIGDFSKLCRVPVSALRYYADIGLLDPNHIDKFTGYRYYSVEQLPKLNRILALRDLGFALEQIKQFLDDELSVDTLQGMMLMKQAEIEQEIEHEQARLRRVVTRIEQIAKEGKMPEQEVILKDIPAQHILAIREVVPTPEHVALLLGQTCAAVFGQAVQPMSTPLIIYHDAEFKDVDLDIEIVLPVNKSAPELIPIDEKRQVTARELPEIQAACIIHTGDYDSLPQSYAVIAAWIENNDYQIVGRVREVYLRPHMGDDEGITEIQFPVSKS
jgi:DNA-binding transcriptional MerR regulator